MPVMLWKGLDHYSTEYCELREHEMGASVSSVVVGKSEDEVYRAAYTIHTDKDWQTKSFELHIEINSARSLIAYQSDSNGNWYEQGKRLPEFEGCIDIDIPLTPFTNTLPIRRLEIPVGERRIIKVLYLDVLAREIKAVWQCYMRLTENKYQYQNIPNDFEAVITVDEDGLVIDYPTLFERIGKADQRTGL